MSSLDDIGSDRRSDPQRQALIGELDSIAARLETSHTKFTQFVDAYQRLGDGPGTPAASPLRDLYKTPATADARPASWAPPDPSLRVPDDHDPYTAGGPSTANEPEGHEGRWPAWAANVVAGCVVLVMLVLALAIVNSV